MMDVLIILVFISLVMVAAAVLFFFREVLTGDFDHADRLSLLPLENEMPVGVSSSAAEDGAEAESPSFQTSGN